MKRRLDCLLLTLLMMVSLVPMSRASDTGSQEAAAALYELGLFLGTGTDANGKPIFELGRIMNRNEAVTMLVRLLGKIDEAKSGRWDTPFTDLAEWVEPIVGYAYENGLTSGQSSDCFGGYASVTASQYITFVLRALGYRSGVDFQWDAAWELSDRLGITNGNYNRGNNGDFTRGDAAVVSYAALHVTRNGSDKTLLETLDIGSNSNSEPDSDLLQPIYTRGEYQWIFHVNITNDTSETLHLEKLQIFMKNAGTTINGGEYVFEGQRLADIGLGNVTLSPNQNIPWNDGHPLVDFFDEKIGRAHV